MFDSVSKRAGNLQNAKDMFSKLPNIGSILQKFVLQFVNENTIRWKSPAANQEGQIKKRISAGHS